MRVVVASVPCLGTHYAALPCARLWPGGTAAARSARRAHYGRRLALNLSQEARQRPAPCVFCVFVVVSVLFLGTHYVALRPGGTAAARSARCTHYGSRLVLGLGQEARRRPSRSLFSCAHGAFFVLADPLRGLSLIHI
eukprot:821908-Alexandrium_andersonii.AAC.1